MLTRKLNEKIRVGNDIVVTVIQIDKGSVKLGFEAPSDVAIHRDEVYEKIAADDKAKTKSGPPEDDSGE
ncbi:MAG: carbon storage regulator CsrA [Desulfosudaceae bacterium]